MNIVDKIVRRINLYQGKHLMLSRVACLGHDVHGLLYADKQLVNQQKVRVDMFNDWARGIQQRPRSEAMRHHMERDDIFALIQQQEALPWLSTKRSSGLILMDSFAELTDQKFTHKKEGWSFACNYSDIKHTEAFADEYECEGLIDINDLGPLYDSFFKLISKRYPGKEIIFLHFPTALDNREKFHARGQAIIDCLEDMSGKYKNLEHFRVEDSMVFPHEGDDFPYHYGKETYRQFARKITGLDTVPVDVPHLQE